MLSTKKIETYKAVFTAVLSTFHFYLYKIASFTGKPFALSNEQAKVLAKISVTIFFWPK